MHSTKDRLSSYWNQIKDFLLSPIEEKVGSLTNKQTQLITALEVVRIEDFILLHFGAGRPPEDEKESAAVPGEAGTRCKRKRQTKDLLVRVN